MHLSTGGDCGVNLAEKLEELLMSMTPMTLADGLTGHDV
jgi:hypothetical protein